MNSEYNPNINLLSIKNVTKKFGGLTAVNNSNFEVHQGEIVGLIGANGAGKTTLFNCITCFFEATSGQIIFDGQDITKFKPYMVSRLGLSRTFQVVKPFGKMTVLENIVVGAYCKYPKKEDAYRIAEETLKLVKIEHLRDVHAHSLTISDRKKLELARALATKPKLLLLDEVMGGLRPNEVNDMLSLIRDIHNQGITILIIEHIMQAIMNISDRIVVVHHGEKIAEGTPEEIAHDPVVLDAYLGGSENLA